MIDRYAVMGDPIAHSLSPKIQQQFAEQCEQTLLYEAQQVTSEDFPSALKTFIEAGGRGLNITLPLKQLAHVAVDSLNESARRAKAVNTIIISKDGQTIGDNTDGVGLCRDLTQNHNIELHDRRVLLLGASGAARGVIAPLIDHAISDLHIANRTQEKAKKLAIEFSDRGSITASGLDALPHTAFDIVINATAASLNGESLNLPPKLLAQATCCYDMFYSKAPTIFLQEAEKAGCAHNFDGRGMLLEQAAESFFLWRGVRPDTRKVHAVLFG